MNADPVIAVPFDADRRACGCACASPHVRDWIAGRNGAPPFGPCACRCHAADGAAPGDVLASGLGRALRRRLRSVPSSLQPDDAPALPDADARRLDQLAALLSAGGPLAERARAALDFLGPRAGFRREKSGQAV